MTEHDFQWQAERIDSGVEAARPRSRGEPTKRPSRAPRMTVGDVGEYYVHDDGTIWRLVAYAAEPTATLRKIDVDGVLREPHPDEIIFVERGGVVGARIFEGFRKLVPADE